MSRLLIQTGLLSLTLHVAAQQPQYPPPFPVAPARPILPSSVNYAPEVTPNVLDPSAPDAQAKCPGYIASNAKESDFGLTADLTLAGPACNVYGNEIHDLRLSVEYQSEERLAVRITPKYLAPANRSLYILDPALTPYPGIKKGFTKGKAKLKFTWTNKPTFQFRVSRASSGEVLFDTYGSKIVFEDQFLELTTSMVPDYNIYGLAETLRGFRLPNNYTITMWNAYSLDNDQVLDVNAHSVHPMYLETRYQNGTSISHGVYARNAHGQEWLLRDKRVTYRTIGGSLDFYFVNGPSAKDVISQYQTGIVGTPVEQPYWALGFHQVRWSYQNWTNLQDVIDAYAAQNIQLEGIMNDLDYLDVNRIFTDNPGHYDIGPGKEFLDRLHANGQYYMPILDPNVYIPNPQNASDAYPPYNRGAELDVYIKNGYDENFYVGVQWPGLSVWPDFLPSVPQTQQFWTEQIKQFHKNLDFDGFWLDVSDPVSFSTGSIGSFIPQNPIHVPFALPGDPNTSVAVIYEYPEKFEVTNSSEAASASAALASQSLAYPTPTATPTPVLGRTLPTPGVRNLTFPPYAINNFLPGHSLVKQVISPDATHNDGPNNSTEYELHNLYGHLSGNATYHALLETYDNKRPFFISRSTFAGSGTFAGHWGGDTNSKWGNMYFGIAQALQFSIVGIPYFGVETCGFNFNADLELCTRWMQLSAWFPLYRNHNNRNTIAQEAYRWATNAESTRRIMNIRYSILPYTYTLFRKAHTAGETVLRALAWEFPDDESLKAVETQFMSGPALLVTPVLEPLATTVKGVFPGVKEGTRWYDWYTLDEVDAKPGENKTLDAPLVHQPIHIRGGYIIPIQKAGNTTKTSRENPWSLIVALDKDGNAEGELFLDDGISYVQKATKNIEVKLNTASSCLTHQLTLKQLKFTKNTLTSQVSGSYDDHLPIANITIVGLKNSLVVGHLTIGKKKPDVSGVPLNCSSSGGYIHFTNLEGASKGGIWSADFTLSLSQ